MKIIIVSKIFHPSNRIGAVRPTNFAVNLAALGHNVTVVTEDLGLAVELDVEGIDIIKVNNSSFVQNLKSRNIKRLSKKRESVKFNDQNLSSGKSLSKKIQVFLKNTLVQFYYLIIELDWYVRSIRRVKKNRWRKNQFDIVISSFGPLASYLVGRSLVKNKIVKYWVADFRDNMISSKYPFWLNFLYRNIEKQASKEADALTFVSLGQREMFLRSKINRIELEGKTFTIYNGFKDTNNSLGYAKRSAGVLKITYTGQLYEGYSNFRMVFHAIDELIKEEKVQKEFITIEYAGQSSREFHRQLEGYTEARSVCRDYGFVSKEKAFKIQKESDILVAITWNTHEEQGILTGKFLEYLQFYKPIIALTSGDLPNSELTQMVRSIGLGIACEYIAYDVDYLALKRFIREQYRAVVHNEEIVYSPDINKISEFRYQNITKQLNKILMAVSSNP